MIVLRDKFANEMDSGGYSPIARLVSESTSGGAESTDADSESTVNLAVFDTGSGAYTTSYIATLRGGYLLDVTLEGAHIGGSPYNVHFGAAETRSDASFFTDAGDTFREHLGKVREHSGEIQGTLMQVAV
jgi:hypothetical protein